jgi:hypothetical protein
MRFTRDSEAVDGGILWNIDVLFTVRAATFLAGVLVGDFDRHIAF